jgi:PAS domain S-box-containing protein
LSAASEQLPDLVLADVTVPDLDGFSLVKQLRAHAQTATVPVILLSAQASEEARVEGLREGADDYLVQPFSARELVARIAARLELGRLRSEAEQRLRESEAKFRTLAEASPAMIWFLDPEGRWRYVNRPFQEFFGRREAELLAEAWGQVVHPDDVLVTTEALRLGLRARQAIRFRARVRRKDGHWRWIESQTRPHLGDDGSYLGQVGHTLDITDTLEASAILREKERSLTAQLASVTRLQQVSSRLVLPGDDQSLYQEIVDAAIAITAADMGVIHRRNAASNRFHLMAGRGFEAPFLEFFSGGREEHASWAAQLAHNYRTVVEDILANPAFVGTPDGNALRSAGVRAFQTTPLVARSGHVMGILTTHYRIPCRPAERDLTLLDVLARQAADWIERTEAEAARWAADPGRAPA